MGLDQQKIIRTFRLSLTCLFLFLVTWYYQVPESAWCLITIWFVMFEYTTIGGVFTKSFLRFSGTFLSAVYGIVIVYFCANNPLINMIAFVCGLFVYSYYFMGGEKTYIGTIGAVTLTIVLLNYNDVDTAIIRVFNIIIGIIGSMLMMRFFYPQFARDKIIEALWDFIEHFVGILEDYLDPSVSLAALKENCLKHDHLIIACFISFGHLVSEAKIETKKTPFFVADNLAALERIRHIFRLISVFVFYVTTEECRSDEWICSQLRFVLSKFRALQRELEAGKVEGVFESLIIVDVPIDPSMKFIEMMLTNISQETVFLEKDIKKVLCSYATYSDRYHDVVNSIET